MGQDLADRHRQRRRESAKLHRNSRVRPNIETKVMDCVCVHETMFTGSPGTEGGGGGSSQGRAKEKTCYHTAS